MGTFFTNVQYSVSAYMHLLYVSVSKYAHKDMTASIYSRPVYVCQELVWHVSVTYVCGMCVQYYRMYLHSHTTALAHTVYLKYCIRDIQYKKKYYSLLKANIFILECYVHLKFLDVL